MKIDYMDLLLKAVSTSIGMAVGGKVSEFVVSQSKKPDDMFAKYGKYIGSAVAGIGLVFLSGQVSGKMKDAVAMAGIGALVYGVRELMSELGFFNVGIGGAGGGNANVTVYTKSYGAQSQSASTGYGSAGASSGVSTKFTP